MTEQPQRRASKVLGWVLVACAVLVLAVLIVTAAGDDGQHPWRGRTLGFVTAAAALGIGVVMRRSAKPAETHYWGMVGALALAALVTGVYSYKPGIPQAGNRAERIPLEIGEWSGTGGEVDEDMENILGTKDIILRSYRRGADQVGLAVIFAMSKRKVAHPPEQCYAAEGYEIEDMRVDPFETKDGRAVDAKRLVIVKGGKIQVVLYWYKAGDYNTSSFFWQQLYVIWSNLLMRPARVALVRFSTYIESVREVPGALETLREFAREAFPEIEDKLK